MQDLPRCPAHIAQEPRMNAHAHCASDMQQGALLRLTGAPCYVERTTRRLQRRVKLWVSTALPARGRQGRTCGCR